MAKKASPPKVHQIPIFSKNQVVDPFVRVVVNGQGQKDDSGSSPNYISISNGNVCLSVSLTPAQAKQIRERGWLATS